MFNSNNNIMTTKDIINLEVDEFIRSEKRRWMFIGQRYYEIDNDILKRQLVIKTEKDGPIEDKDKINNKLAHAHYKNLVDEKVNYIFGKQYSIQCDNTKYVENITKCLGKYFLDKINELGYEASNKGVGWLHVYLNNQGEFCTIVIPSEECCPIWKDRNHTELEAMARVYNQVIYVGKKKKTITKVEYWTSDTVDYYIKDGSNLILDSEMYLNSERLGHYSKDGEELSFGKVPFLAFKNNRYEMPDIKSVKSLADDYDLNRSEVSNLLAEVRNLIYVLKGYGEQDKGEFVKDLAYYRAIVLEDSDGDVSTLTPKIDIQAAKEHWEQLRRDIIRNGQGVDCDLDKMGSSPSGKTLEFLYAALDIKCNLIDVLFSRAFEELLYFINIYLNEDSIDICNDCVEIIFNRDIKINESEAIKNCIDSKSTISDKTIMANHPWVSNLEEEIARLEEQEKKELNSLEVDRIPININAESIEDNE